MEIIESSVALHDWLASQLSQRGDASASIGFVPTMGALHQGHKELIIRAVQENPITICSIFVNPTQFNDPKDFAMYPRARHTDLEFLSDTGLGAVWLPSEQDIYPEEGHKSSGFELGYLGDIFEGAYRPGHFEGMCGVVARLLALSTPDRLYMGRKDYQQLLIVKHMVQWLGLAPKLTVVECDTIRSSDGLALSSRNALLSPEGKEHALDLHRSLTMATQMWLDGESVHALRQATKAYFTQREAYLRLEYFDICDADTLVPCNSTDKRGSKRVVLLIAGYVEGIRLIDNKVIDSE